MGKKYRNQLVSTDVKSGETTYIREEIVEPAAPEATEELMDFEGWFALRKDLIPRHHHVEIIKADFKGRNVPELATMAQFDEALKKYGVKLV